MDAQNEISVHFLIMLASASLFAFGIVLYIIDFFKYGRPVDTPSQQVEDSFIAVSE